MSFLERFWRLSAVALVAAVPFVAACSDDDGAEPQLQEPPPVTGTISGTVSSTEGGAIVGALVGTSPATATALTDANGGFTITNVPIPTNPTSYAVTASKDGFSSASTSVSLSSTSPTATATIALAPDTGPPVPTTGDLNVLVTNNNGTPQSGADVTVSDAAGAVAAMATTDANGFAIFNDLAIGAYTVSATASISGIDFRASGGTNIAGGETSFLQLTLRRDFGQSVFPNVGGDPVTLDSSADIRFVPVPGGTDSDPSVDCNVIRTQHMFIAEVVLGDADDTPVSGVKIQWDLNISTGQNPFLGQPGNTGSIVDSDDPDLDPATARSGLDPAFNVDTRKAVTFTNDNDQTIAFNNTNVVVGPGQSWIIITSPVEGITDVIAATPDIPADDPDCANSSPDACDKEFAIKRWVNWDTAVFELDWPLANRDTVTDPNAEDPDEIDFISIADGSTVTNVLDRVEPDCTVDQDGGVAGVQCALFDNELLIYAEVQPLRTDSPFQAFNNGVIKFDITDDSPDVEFFTDQTFSHVEGSIPEFGNILDTTQDDVAFGPDFDHFEGEFDFCNNKDDQGNILIGVCQDADLTGWVIAQATLNPAIYWCHDVNADTVCDPGNVGSTDSFSSAYQALLNGNADNTNSFTVTWCDQFGEDCDRLDFDKEWVASRVQIIKNFPGATRQEIETLNGPDRPTKTHTIQVGQEFSYTITVINDGEVQSPNVRITDTLPRFGIQFEGPPDNGVVRDGAQAFAYVTDRPTFDPVAVVYAIDDGNDDDGDVIDECIRGDDGSVVGDAYVTPAICLGIETDVGSVSAARSQAENRSADGDQVVWIQWFDESILGRQQPGGGIETEDTVEVTLVADEDLVDIDPADALTNGYDGVLPGVWCNIATVTDGPGNLDDSPLTTQSLDADTLCHEVVEALLQVRKTTQDAVISAGAQAEFEVEIDNAGSATLTNTVIVDTLDQALFDATPMFDENNITLDPTFAGATVTVNGRIFTVDIGNLAPTSDFESVYTVVVNTPGEAGVFCNRVTASGTTPAGTISDQDIACVTTTITIELDISNEDGFIDQAGVFQSSKETFVVGEGGPGDDAFVYRVDVINQSPFSATGVSVDDEVAPNTGAIRCVEVLAAAPAGEGGGANPSIGTVSGGDCSDSGFTWTIGTLGAGQQATIFFRAEALAAQSGVGNRVRLTSDQLTGEIVDEEPTTVTSN